MELIKNKDTLGVTDEYKERISLFTDRYTHLFLNSLTTFPFNEPLFYLHQAVQRMAIEAKGLQFPPEKLVTLIDLIKALIRHEAMTTL